MYFKYWLPLFCIGLSAQLSAQAPKFDNEGFLKTLPPASDAKNQPLTPEGFQRAMHSVYSNARQAKKDTSQSVFKAETIVVVRPIWTERTDGSWLHFSRMFVSTGQPLVQSVYQVTQPHPDTLLVTLRFLDPTQGHRRLYDWRKPQPLSDLTAEDILAHSASGCQVLVTRGEQPNSFKGKVGGDGRCTFPQPIGPAAGLSIEYIVDPSGMSLTDALYGLDGQPLQTGGGSFYDRLSAKDVGKLLKRIDEKNAPRRK